MVDLEFDFETRLWEYLGQGSWHFVTLPKGISEDIKAFTKHSAKGFRTVRVTVTIGKSKWQTSLFPDRKSGAYLLPIKAAIRKKEKLAAGDILNVSLSVMI